MTKKHLKYLWFFSGEDYILIQKCTSNVQRQFSAIGVWVIFISLCTLLSILSLVFHVFDETPLIFKVLIGGLWSALIFLLYLFLLYTISPTLLPVSKNSRKPVKFETKEVKENFIYTPTEISRLTSLALRIVMIISLAIFIAQPLNMFTLRLSAQSDSYMSAMKNILINSPNFYFLTIVWSILFLIPVYLKFKIRNNQTSPVEFERCGNAKYDLEDIRSQLASPNNFESLFNKIRSVNIGNFRTNDFYYYKSLVEYKIILHEYDSFRERHNNMLKQCIATYNQRLTQALENNSIPTSLKNSISQDPYYKYLLSYQIEKYEFFEDAPFRTRPIIDRTVFDSEENFIKTLYES